MTDGGVRLDSLGDVLTIEELAQLLRCSVSTVKRRLRDGVFPIPPLQGIDSKFRFSKISVRRYLDSGVPVRARRG